MSKDSRVVNNIKILDHIRDYVSRNPDLRFNQVLINLGISENGLRFYEESHTTLIKVQKELEKNNVSKILQECSDKIPK